MKKTNPAPGRWSRRCAAAALALFLAGVARAGADDSAMPAWATSRVSSDMCEGSTLHLVVTGGVDVVFERAYAVLAVTNLLENLDAAYRRTLPPGAKTNLVITPTGTSGRYTVVWKGDPSDVCEWWSQTDTNRFFERGYVITGERFFGTFEAVMNVRVQRMDNGRTGFRADAFIYLHNGFLRFVFNNLLSVDYYFHDTLDTMSAEVARLCTYLCQPRQAPAGTESVTRIGR